MVLRSLPMFSMHKLPILPPSITFLIILVSVFSIFSIITFLCASHKFTGFQKEEKKTKRLGGSDHKKPLAKLQSNISSKALLMAKMISWKRVQDHDEEEGISSEDDEAALWRRTIIMGERCRPLEFSGKISYDSHGNPLPSDSSHGNSNRVSSTKS